MYNYHNTPTVEHVSFRLLYSLSLVRRRIFHAGSLRDMLAPCTLFSS
ncbi:unnamed protein product [Arabidopsis halleri]